jgi:hypothetical protein
MNNLLIKRSQLVTAQITGTPATGRRYNFLEIPNLSRNNIILYGFECYTRTQLARTPDNLLPITAGNIHGVVLTLRDNDKVEFVYQVPCYNLIRSNVGGFITMMKPRIINLTDSYIQLTDVGTIAQDDAAVFNFYYQLVGE